MVAWQLPHPILIHNTVTTKRHLQVSQEFRKQIIQITNWMQSAFREINNLQSEDVHLLEERRDPLDLRCQSVTPTHYQQHGGVQGAGTETLEEI